jgi:hypothetical protein
MDQYGFNALLEKVVRKLQLRPLGCIPSTQRLDFEQRQNLQLNHLSSLQKPHQITGNLRYF